MTRISYMDFEQQLLHFGVFSINDIKKIYPDFDSRRLNEWQKKKYISKIVNKWYQFNKLENTEQVLWWLSNRILQPSYISLESALSYYGFIPEGVFTVTAVTTVKTFKIASKDNNFTYQSIKPGLFFGYNILKQQNWPIKFAQAEKALLDYLYLNPHIKTIEDIEALRLNKGQVLSVINKEIFDNYVELFESEALEKRVKLMENYLNADT